ncbi:MAG: molybdate ABC transporter substrate-binding protein [Chlorobi bacterium]|nr:MAG: Molybdate-binding periplasmic protein precursor [Chlorobi bacterium OLB7]MBK8910836.1 molybdate ABC transporter substrate-binding protein [Chlorobiota bacterium]MBX7216102.1 molybdate ABC transporter substrate-binding protein [Candidatus Kapabacteria bacterium]
MQQRTRWTLAAVAIAVAAVSLWFLFSPKEQQGGKAVAVAVASNMKFAFEDITAAFKKEHPGITVTASYGSSGNFYAQLSNRAPFDLFLSADIEYPNKLSEQKLILPGSQFIYAVGELVIWVPTGSPLDLSLGIRALLDSSVRHIAVANPEHAPYGRAAIAALTNSGIYAQVKPRLIYGDNITQTAQFAQTGAADVGIIALSLVVAPAMRNAGKYVKIPLEQYPRLEQAGVILNWAADPESAQLLRAFITGPRGKEILHQYGFSAPEG